ELGQVLVEPWNRSGSESESEKAHLRALTHVACPARLQLCSEHVTGTQLTARGLIVVGGRLRPPCRPQDHCWQLAAIFDHAREDAPDQCPLSEPGSRFCAEDVQRAVRQSGGLLSTRYPVFG